MLKIKHIHATFQHHEIFSIFSCWKLPTSNLEALWAHLPAPSIIWKQICCESPLWHVFFIRITQCLSVSVDFNTADTKDKLDDMMSLLSFLWLDGNIVLPQFGLICCSPDFRCTFTVLLCLHVYFYIMGFMYVHDLLFSFHYCLHACIIQSDCYFTSQLQIVTD